MGRWDDIKHAFFRGVCLLIALWSNTKAYAGDGIPVTSMTTIRIPATSSGPYNIDRYTINYGVGDDVQITAVNVGSLSLPLLRSSVSKPNIKINRIDNLNASGERMTLFYPGLVSRRTVNIVGSEALNMDIAMSDDSITSGGLDIFMNVDSGVERANNIERVDYIVPAGINLPTTAALLNEIGTVANEKHGNNSYQIAMITSLDAFGQPASYASLKTIQGNVDYGNMGRPQDSSGTFLRNLYIRNGPAPVAGGGNGPLAYIRGDTNFIGLSFVSFASMGASPGQTVYGYSLFPNDVSDANDLVGLSDVPLTTGGRNGGDIYGGTFAIFATPAAEAEVSEGGAVLTGQKTVSVYDPTSSGLYAIPGNDVIYVIDIKNEGTGPADANSLFLVDDLPEEVIFYNNDIDDGGPATDPVVFIDSGSGLSFNYATDVKYATGVTKPTSNSDCDYNPVAGYDPNVKFICISPSGVLRAGTPDPSFSIQFRTQIK